MITLLLYWWNETVLRKTAKARWDCPLGQLKDKK